LFLGGILIELVGTLNVHNYTILGEKKKNGYRVIKELLNYSDELLPLFLMAANLRKCIVSDGVIRREFLIFLYNCYFLAIMRLS
jgi:hypothetical protein